MNGILYLQDGTVYEGNGFGKLGTSVGELVFNTSMTGYQEILTDPSYAGQIITMTYPLIGNYGINTFESESTKVYARGYVAKSISENPSNYLSEITIDKFLNDMNVVGVYDVDTRMITKKIRNSGAMKCVISNEGLSIPELKQILEHTEFTENYMEEVSRKETFNIEGKGHKVVLFDFGAKSNIIENLKKRDCNVTIVPYNTTFEEVLNLNPDGILLSNGPGDPKTLTEIVENVKRIMKIFPTFGICLGHQILALAVGGDTYKMKYGHRGGNHGVYDIERDRAYITAQNHGYAVDENSIEGSGMVVTHINLNDKTVEGMTHTSLPVFSVQFHPEGSPGPQDSAYLFDKFIALMEAKK